MSQQGVYNESKMIWWFSREGKLPESPKQVQLILSDLCNQDCSFCAYRMSGYTSNELFIGDSEPAKYGHSNPKRFIPRDRALSLLTEMQEAGVLAIQFTGGGEPTVHPDCDEIFRAALQLGFRCALVSNGVKWSRPLMRDLIPKFDWVRISIDAGHAGSYASIRNTPVGNFDRVWGNVTTTAERIGAAGTQTVLGVGFVVTPTSYPEILEFAHAAKYSGAHNARFTAMFSPEDDKPFRECYSRIKVELDCAKKLETDTFKVHDNFGSRFADLEQQAPDYSSCSYQHYTSYIGGDLNVYRCCLLAYNKRGLVKGGNLKERSFSEFWASQERKDDMAALDARGCERCQFNTKNREMLYVMGDTASDTTPRHMEWP